MSNRRPSHLILGVEGIEPRLCPSSGVFGNVFEVMLLLHRVAEQQRATARETRELAREAQHEAIHTQAEKIREAANFKLAAGIVTGASSIAGGVASVGAGRSGISAAGRADKMTHEGRTIGEAGQVGSLSHMLGGIGQLEHSALHAISEARQAEQKALVSEMRKHQANQEVLAEFQQQMDAMLKQIQEQLARMHEAQERLTANIR